MGFGHVTVGKPIDLAFLFRDEDWSRTVFDAALGAFAGGFCTIAIARAAGGITDPAGHFRAERHGGNKQEGCEELHIMIVAGLMEENQIHFSRRSKISRLKVTRAIITITI